MWFYTHVVLQSFPTSPEKAMGYKNERRGSQYRRSSRVQAFALPTHRDKQRSQPTPRCTIYGVRTPRRQLLSAMMMPRYNASPVDVLSCRILPWVQSCEV